MKNKDRVCILAEDMPREKIIQAVEELCATFPDGYVLVDLYLVTHGKERGFHSGNSQQKENVAISLGLCRRGASRLVPFSDTVENILKEILVEGRDKKVSIKKCLP